MVEFDVFRVEDMTSELIEMESSGLFDKEYVNTVRQRRKDFENRILHKSKNKEEYLKYIRHELRLLQMLRARRQRLGGEASRTHLDYAVINRVINLFKQAISRFQDDIRLWLSHIKFCFQVKFNSCASRLLVNLLQIHGDKPYLWQQAAIWEFQENRSVENARQYILRGLRLHPDSKTLYTQAFRLELMFTDMKRKKYTGVQVNGSDSVDPKSTPANPVAPDESLGVAYYSFQLRAGASTADQVVGGHMAEVLYESAARKIGDIHFFIDLLNTAQEFSFTNKLQCRILRDLLCNFPNDELTWHTLATREMKGLACPQDSVAEVLHTNGDCFDISDDSDSQSTDGKNILKERIHQCCSLYKVALKRIPTDLMWTFYLDTLLDLSRDSAELPIFKKKQLYTAFKDAHLAGKMKEKYYLYWADLSVGKNKKLSNILRAATERIPSSSELWQKRLAFHISVDEEEIVEIIFRDSISQIGIEDPSVLMIWKMYIQYWQLKSTAKVEQIFLKGVLTPSTAVSSALKTMFLEWLVLTKDIKPVRKIYETLATQEPHCLELHRKMIFLENMQIVPDLKQIRRSYELACEQFGNVNPDVWLEYIKFEIKNNRNLNDVENLNSRAKLMLESKHRDAFESKFCFIKAEMKFASID